MNIRHVFLLGCFSVLGLAGCASTNPSTRTTTDSGYFLSMRQKGQLIGTGSIQDSAGTWYDIWVVPGYVKPAQRVWTNAGKTVSHLSEYGQGEKYRSLGHHSKNALVWAFDDCLYDFTIKGIPNAWGDHFSAAHTRTQKRVFGWWFAYPWALLEGVVETVVRIPIGAAGTTLGTAWGIAVVPGYYTVNSAVKATWSLAVDTVLFPVAGIAWNTVVAPPMALAGQKPSRERTDGFWVRASVESPIKKKLSPEEIEAIANWGLLLMNETKAYEEQQHQLGTQLQEQMNALYKQMETLNKSSSKQIEAITTAQAEHVRRLYTEYPAATPDKTAWTPAMIMSQDIQQPLRERLKMQQDLPPNAEDRILQLLRQYPPPAGMRPPADREKTDPVQRSTEILKNI